MGSKKGAKSFGETVRAKRVAKGITLRDFARLLGVSPTYVSQIEQDKFSPPTEDRIVKMAQILHEDPDELLALAGRVAEDLPEIIRKHPREMATFLREINGMTAGDIKRLSDQAKKLKQSGKDDTE